MSVPLASLSGSSSEATPLGSGDQPLRLALPEIILLDGFACCAGARKWDLSFRFLNEYPPTWSSVWEDENTTILRTMIFGGLFSLNEVRAVGPCAPLPLPEPPRTPLLALLDEGQSLAEAEGWIYV